MADWLKKFFDHFGKVQHLKYYPKEMPTQTIAADIAKQWNKNTQPGHGMFVDFSQTPELEKPCLDILQNRYGWVLEKPFFIRKQNHDDN